MGSILGLGRSPAGGNGIPLQYSCLKNSMGRGACWATVHEMVKSGMQLSIYTHNTKNLTFKSVRKQLLKPGIWSTTHHLASTQL